MKMIIIDIDRVESSKILAALAGQISCFFAVLGLIFLTVGNEANIEWKFIVSIYISVSIFCVIYNFVAKRTGVIAFYQGPG